jgi:hypothetical protein
LAIFTIIFLPVLQTHYFFVDDYLLISPNASQSQLYHRVFLGSIGSGRAAAGFVEYGVFRLVQNLQSSGLERMVRFVGLIGLVLLSYVVFVIFRACRMRTAYAFMGSILICSLPAFQVYVSWLIINSVPYGTALAALSGLILLKNAFKENNGRSSYRKGSVLFAILFLVMSLHFYQPAAMFYWSVGIIYLALLRDEDLRKKWRTPVYTYFSVGCIAMMIHFINVKTVSFVMGFAPGFRGSLIPLTREAIVFKIKWFLTNPLINGLNLWNISPTYMLAGIVGIIITTGFLVSLRVAALQAMRERRFDLISHHAQRIFLIIAMIPLSILPTLLVTESWATYRTIVALEASLCVLFFISLLNIEEVLKSGRFLPDKIKKVIMPLILILLSALVVVNARGNVKRYFADLHSMELKYVKDTIRGYGISKLSESSVIYVRGPDKKYFLDNQFRFEFGYPSSIEDGGYGVYAFGEYLVKYALYELGITNEMNIINVSAVEPIPEDSNNLVVDFNKFKYYLKERFKQKKQGH